MRIASSKKPLRSVSCVEWLESLSTQETQVVNLRPEDDYPETDDVAVDQSRVIRVLRRIAHDLEELARARRVRIYLQAETMLTPVCACVVAWQNLRLNSPDGARAFCKAAKPGRIMNTDSRKLDSQPR